jgi:hypothetical protein
MCVEDDSGNACLFAAESTVEEDEGIQVDDIRLFSEADFSGCPDR